MDIPAADLADLILRVARRLRTANAAELQGLPVNPHQARALRVVARLEPVRPSAVADRLHVAPRSATDVVEFLIAGGWVERSPDPDDGRAQALSLTDEGVDLLRAIRGSRDQWLQGVLADWPPEDVEAFGRHLEHFASDLEASLLTVSRRTDR